jgi:HlyD family secretion protein
MNRRMLLATDETRMRHGSAARDFSYPCSIRVASVAQIRPVVRFAALGLLCGAALLVSGCAQSAADSGVLQGYVEGEFVYVAPTTAGLLNKLHVARGQQISAGAELFAIDRAPAQAARDEAAFKLAEARATFHDLTKGKRPTEIAAVTAQLKQAQAALAFSETELARQQDLARSNATAPTDVQQALAAREQDRQRVAQLEAELKTAHLPAREDQIEAARASVKALEAVVARTEYDLAQTRPRAPASGLVFDTIYREGEWIAAGRPVVALLPPANVKVRAFVPEMRIGGVQVGDEASVTVDGLPAAVTGKVSFVSPRAEFTPPVIYSQESRAKLVFMIEIVFDPDTAARLHPGQPVSVRLE